MSKRIQELAEQAGYHPDVYELCKHGMEKFAKLILQDVLAICEEKGDQGLDGHYCADEIARLYK